MIVTLCTGKGGTGKSTLAILLATALAEAGHDAAVLDTDPQQTARRWLESTDSNQVQTGTILARELDEMAERIGLHALKNVLHRRQAYQHAVLLGWKSLPPEAREEVLKTALEITALAKKGK